MAEISLPVIVTAVADSELEGFISGTLFSQGWNVIYRSLDVASLTLYLDRLGQGAENVILIFSPDLSGMTPDIVSNLKVKVKQVIGFSMDSRYFDQFQDVLPRPKDATELISLVRGFVRAPLLRSHLPIRDTKRRAKIIAIASPAGSAGCTTMAINLATEFSVEGNETLILDADVRRPAIATLLSLHGLDEEETPRVIAPKLQASEFSRGRVKKLNEYMDAFVEKFDFIVVDLGSIEGIEDSLTDRRWTSSMIHWSCDQADELWLVGKADVLGIARMDNLARNFEQINIRAKISLLLNMRAVGRKGGDEEKRFLAIATKMKPKRVFTLPKDLGSVSSAENSRSTLVEVAPRSSIRKAIVKLAHEVVP